MRQLRGDSLTCDGLWVAALTVQNAPDEKSFSLKCHPILAMGVKMGTAYR